MTILIIYLIIGFFGGYYCARKCYQDTYLAFLSILTWIVFGIYWPIAVPMTYFRYEDNKPNWDFSKFWMKVFGGKP